MAGEPTEPTLAEPQAEPGLPEAPRPRVSRWRWGVALAVVLVVALVSAGAFFVLSGGGSAARSLTAGNAPANTQLFLDFRTDLPGDQHQKLADFMAHFPGFADRAQFDNAFDELLNRITARISPDFTYTSALRGWTSGEISVAVTRLSIPQPEILTTINGFFGPIFSSTALPKLQEPGPGPSNMRAVVIVSVKDRAAAQAWIDAQASRTGLVFEETTYSGALLHETSSGADPVAYALTDRVLIAGSADVVRQALDAPHAKAGSLADGAGYQAAMKSLSGDGVAMFYADPRSIARASRISVADPIMSLLGMVGLKAPVLPVWVAGLVRADSNRMTVEMTMPRVAPPGAASNGESNLPAKLPGSTVAVLEARSFGTLLSAIADSSGNAGSGSSPETGASVQARQVVDLLGGIGWIGDSTLVVTRRGLVYDSGLVIQTADAKTASDKRGLLAGLMSLLELGSKVAPGVGIQSSQQSYKGATIDSYVVSASGIPTLHLALATKDELIIVGLSDGFVRQMLDVAPGSSLADQAGYRTAMADAGRSNSGSAYLDIPSLEDEVGRISFPGQEEFFRANYKPYLDHVGSIAAAVIDGRIVVVRVVVTAR